MNDQAEIHTPLEQEAMAWHELFLALQVGGFNENQALRLIANMATNNATNSTDEDDSGE